MKNLVTSKTSWTSVKDITNRINIIKASEDSIYYILRNANKKMIAEMMGMSRGYIYHRIKHRCFTIDELYKIFQRIEDFKDEEFKKARIDRMKKFRDVKLEDL